LLFNWFDFTPKIGITNMLVKEKPVDSSISTGYEFELHRAPTLGAEIGVEKRTPYFLVRLWVYSTYSLGVVKLDRKYKSSSIRVGADLYRDLYSLGSTKIALLGFTAADSTNISRRTTSAELEANPETVTGISYKSFFVGTGLTLTW